MADAYVIDEWSQRKFRRQVRDETGEAVAVYSLSSVLRP